MENYELAIFHFLHHCLNLLLIRNVHHSDHGKADIDFDVAVTVVLVVVVDFNALNQRIHKSRGSVP